MTSLNDFADAIERGDATTVRSMIETCAVDVNARLPAGFSPPSLVLAAQRGHAAVVDILLAAGARLNGTDTSRRTACYVAASNGHADVLAVLLAHRANLALANSDSNTPMDIAIARNQARCVLMLIEAGAPLANRGRLCKAAALSTAVIQALLDRGVVVRKLRDPKQATPLHYAIRPDLHNPAVMDMLVYRCGVDIDARDSSGDSCCQKAALRNLERQVRWLINAGTDIEIANIDGLTALHIACFQGHLPCVLMLLAVNANVHARTTDGNTPSHMAASEPSLDRREDSQDLQIVHLLLSLGARLDEVNVNGLTANDIVIDRGMYIDPVAFIQARRDIAKTRLDFVRYRALEVCIGLQSQGLDALQLCEILQHACGQVAPLIRFHQWWAIATTVKHFRKE